MSGNEEKMLSDGVCKFLQDLHFNLDDKIVLVLAWKFKAQIQGEFSREEFYNAMIELGYKLLIKCFFFSIYSLLVHQAGDSNHVS